MNPDEDPYPGSFLQPDSYTCVPTAFAFLYSWQCQVNFHKILKELVETSYRLFEVENDGMEFADLVRVAKKLKIPVELSSSKPLIPSYLTGVKSLPKKTRQTNQLMKQAQKDGSLIIDRDKFIYPEGHAVAVFESFAGIEVFDSFLGEKIQLTKTELVASLEENPEYLIITNCSYE